jgi:hypothetical protein
MIRTFNERLASQKQVAEKCHTDSQNSGGRLK